MAVRIALDSPVVLTTANIWQFVLEVKQNFRIAGFKTHCIVISPRDGDGKDNGNGCEMKARLDTKQEELRARLREDIKSGQEEMKSTINAFQKKWMLR
jgi:hypothetical protein